MARKLRVGCIIDELITIVVVGEVSGKFKVNRTNVGIGAGDKRESRGLVHDRKEIALPFMIERGSCMFNGSSSKFSKNALRSVESASPRILIEWGYVIRIKEAKPSCDPLPAS